MAQIRCWEPRCVWCGTKCGSTRNSSNPPSSPPHTPAGKCPSSPTGKHAPRWEEV